MKMNGKTWQRHVMLLSTLTLNSDVYRVQEHFMISVVEILVTTILIFCASVTRLRLSMVAAASVAVVVVVVIVVVVL